MSQGRGTLRSVIKEHFGGGSILKIPKMEKIREITPENETSLILHNFVQTVGHDGGMHKAYEWRNSIMTIGLYYDRGYFDCNLIASNEPQNSLGLISLLKYLNDDISFYEKELDEVKLWRTLTTPGYFNLFFSFYDKIKNFFENYNADSYNDIQIFFEKKNAL